MKKLKCKNKNAILVSMCITILLANTITLYITFLKAYFNNYKTVITINSYNEALIEFIFLPLVIILGFYALKLVLSKNYIYGYIYFTKKYK